MSPAELLLKHLQSIGDVTEQDRTLIRSLPVTARRFEANKTIVFQGSEPNRSMLVISGVVARHHEFADGMRQTVSFHYKGELPDLHALFLRRIDHSLATVTEAIVGLIPHDELRRVVRESPTLTALFWRMTLIDAAIFRQWITNNGCRGATAGMAHLLCEFVVRSRTIGDLAPDGSVSMPFTQRHLGDALGMSLVHVNRTLRAIREANAAAVERGRLKVLDWEALVKIAGFDPLYLHVKEQAAE